MKVTKVTVQFNCTIPTQNYGNIQPGATWEANLDEGESPEAASRELFNRIRDEIMAAVTPIAQAKMKQVQPVLDALPRDHRDALMQTFGIIQWLQTVAPESLFAAKPASVSGAGVTTDRTNGRGSNGAMNDLMDEFGSRKQNPRDIEDRYLQEAEQLDDKIRRESGGA